MSAQDNVQRLRELLRATDAGDLERVLSFYAPTYRDHDASEARHGTNQLDALRAAFPRFYAAFSDTKHTLDDVIADGDKVAVRLSVTARHTGEIYGIAASGAVVQNDSIVIYRFENGLICERWCRERQSTRAALTAAIAAASPSTPG
jgi:predicted ester cyclase